MAPSVLRGCEQPGLYDGPGMFALGQFVYADLGPGAESVTACVVQVIGPETQRRYLVEFRPDTGRGRRLLDPRFLRAV